MPGLFPGIASPGARTAPLLRSGGRRRISTRSRRLAKVKAENRARARGRLDGLGPPSGRSANLAIVATRSIARELITAARPLKASMRRRPSTFALAINIPVTVSRLPGGLFDDPRLLLLAVVAGMSVLAIFWFLTDTAVVPRARSGPTRPISPTAGTCSTPAAALRATPRPAGRQPNSEAASP